MEREIMKETNKLSDEEKLALSKKEAEKQLLKHVIAI
jgi:hypothetical protein